MADTKISALPAATTPLAGTEQIPVVQGGETRRVSASAIGGGGAKLHPGYAADYGGVANWYTGWDCPFSSSSIYASNTTQYHPLILPVATTIVRLGIVVLTGASSSTARLGIYNSENGRPTTRIVESPTVTADSSGFKESVLATPLFLAAGTYWLASYTNGNSAQYSGYGYSGAVAYHKIGQYYPMNAHYNGSSVGGLMNGVSAMPASQTASEVGHNNASTHVPAVFFQVSA